MNQDNTPSGPERSVEELAKEYAEKECPIKPEMEYYEQGLDEPYYDYREEKFFEQVSIRSAFKAGFLAASPKGKEEETELLELRAWKESATKVMPDMQAIGKEIGVKLGESIHDKIFPAIINYKKLLGQQGERMFTLVEAMDIWTTAVNFTYNEEYGKIPNSSPNIKQYFKDKFGINLD